MDIFCDIDGGFVWDRDCDVSACDCDCDCDGSICECDCDCDVSACECDYWEDID